METNDSIEFRQKLEKLKTQVSGAISYLDSGAKTYPDNTEPKYGGGGFAVGDFVVRDRFPEGVPDRKPIKLANLELSNALELPNH